MFARFASAFLSLSLLIALPAAAKPHTVPAYQGTDDLAVPVHEAMQARAQGRRVLVVFDIDNTLLTAPQDLGSDAWYVWKRGQDDATTPEGRKAVSDLLRDNSAILTLSTMRPTQPDMADLIHALQGHGVDVYALSARGPDLRGATERVLNAAGVDLSPAPECGAPLCTRRDNLGDTQIRAAVKHANWPNTGPFRTITVSDGLMLASGQDKGMMLALLLDSLPVRYTDVWFVDDTLDNVEAVRKAAPRVRARLHPYAYERMWKPSADFMQDKARQDAAEQQMSGLRGQLCDAVKSILCPQP